MNYQQKNASQKKRRIVVACLVFLAILFVVAFFARHKIKDFLSSEEPSQTQTTPLETTSANDVNYGPSNPTENDQINEQKKNADSQSSTPVNKDMVATITNTRVVNTLAQVSVLVEGTTSGNCSLKLTGPSGQTVSKSVAIILRGGQYSCDDFNIPVSSLTIGKWTASLTLEATGKVSEPATAILEVPSNG